MMKYEDLARKECLDWQREMMRRPSLIGRTAKAVQNKINEKIPAHVHRAITEAVKHMVQAVLKGSEWTSREPVAETLTLAEREALMRDKIRFYKRLAAAEGAGTGAGGFMLTLADFPALIAIKIKLLYDAAAIYSFDAKQPLERLYILYVFQTAFSSGEKRRAAFLKLKNWEETVKSFQTDGTALELIDWQSFQQEYRDTIDLAKLLQFLPGFGAVVGAVANYRFLDELGRTAMNAYRMRLLF
nr:EcsC family protein [Caenibacillus caldisaponilyticus]